jgi:hypothetical protein
VTQPSKAQLSSPPLPHLTPKEPRHYGAVVLIAFNYLSLAATASLVLVLKYNTPIARVFFILLVLVAVLGWVLWLKKLIEFLAGWHRQKTDSNEMQ